MRTPSQIELELAQLREALFAAWSYPVGTPVSVTRDDGSVTEHTTRSAAWLTSSGHPVIMLSEISACYALERVRLRPMSEDPPTAAPQDQYYILDSRGCCGDCASWWRVGGQGYTCQLAEAGIYPQSYAKGLRETDILVPVAVARAATVEHVRFDHVRYHQQAIVGRTLKSPVP